MANPALRTRFLAPGDKLGKFDLIRQIAVGGMAELYLARTMGIEGFEKLVVVKRILPQFADNQSFVNMFLNEARLSATLHHPNIAQVYDIGVEERDYFFSMEYVHGEDLGRLIVTAAENGVPVSLDVALTLVAGLCAGLHYAHEKAGPDGKPLAVVHRDVSPSNVLVSYDGAVKLVDFGIARAGSAPATTRGGLKGKIAYMSPEQCRGKATLDRRSDVFSAGTILYELTTGQLPFTDETEYGVLNQIVNTDAPPPSTIVADYPKALEAIVMKALSRDVEQRYASALELQGALEDFAHENRLRVSPLVLARLMSTLFPARLEEWDHARAQGAFFVEQHVLRTLIESGKTSDHSALAAQLPAPAPAPVHPPTGDDEDSTAVTSVMVAPEPPTQVQPVVIHNPFEAAESGETLPGPGVPAPPRRLPTPPPVPPQRILTPVPGAVPVTPAPVAAVAPMPGMMPGAAGTLVSNNAADAAPVAASPVSDVTERVRVPMPLPQRAREETAFIRPERSRLPLYLAILAVLGIGAAIAVVMMGGSDEAQVAADPSPAEPPREAAKPTEDPAATTDDVTTPEEPAEIDLATPPEEPTAPPEEPAEPTAPPTEVAAPAVDAPPARVEPAPKRNRPRPPRKEPRKVDAKKPEPKKSDVKKPEPKKEPSWNDESPFMPVRTDKR